MAVREILFDPSDPFVRPLIEAGVRACQEIYAEHGATGAALRASVTTTHDFADEASQALFERVQRPNRLPLACASGCAACCHGSVLLQAPEALALAAHLRATRSPEELGALEARLAATLDRVRPMSQEERVAARVPCPLLDADRGACTAYEARPIACRAYNSTRRAACDAAFDRGDASPMLPSDPVVFRSTHAAGFGLMAATALAGRDVGPYELANALDAALRDPTTEDRWLRGEAVFAHTRVSAEGAPGFAAIVDGVAADFRAGRMREALRIAKSDPEARRKARNLRKAQKKR